MHGKIAKLFIKIGATQTDLSAYLTKTGLARKADTAEVSTLGTNDKAYLNGMRDGTLSLDGFFDPAVDQVLASIVGGTTSPTFKYFPQGSVVGRIYYTGNVILTDYEIATDTGGAGAVTGALQATGAITRGTA